MSTLRVEGIRNAAASSDAITLAANGTCTAKVTNSLSNRNMIYNGAMMISQRGTSQTGVNSSGFKKMPDRWRFGAAGSNIGTYTVSQAGDNPDAFTGGGKSLKVDCTTAHSSLASNERYVLEQNFEGFDCQPILAGNSNAKKLTLSFWVKAYQTGTWIVHLDAAHSQRDCSASYTINASGTWEKKTITFPADTSGSYACSNAKNLVVKFGLLAGSQWNTGTLNTAWRSEADSGSYTGQTNLASSTNNYWQITGVQLEVGDVATDFEHRTYGDELLRCQRYYNRVFDMNGQSGEKPISLAVYENGSILTTIFNFLEMRTIPSLDITNGTDKFMIRRQDGSDSFNTMTFRYGTRTTAELTINSNVSGNSGVVGMLRGAASDTYIAFSAEL